MPVFVNNYATKHSPDHSWWHLSHRMIPNRHTPSSPEPPSCRYRDAPIGSDARATLDSGQFMQIRDGIVNAIGHTPLIRLKHASEMTGCTILGKAEFMNPGQSVKDRAALFIINDAVRKGELRPGGVIVEGTAGNTGIGLALVGNAMGFRSVIVIPETQSQEKKDTLRLA